MRSVGTTEHRLCADDAGGVKDEERGAWELSIVSASRALTLTLTLTLAPKSCTCEVPLVADAAPIPQPTYAPLRNMAKKATNHRSTPSTTRVLNEHAAARSTSVISSSSSSSNSRLRTSSYAWCAPCSLISCE